MERIIAIVLIGAVIFIAACSPDDDLVDMEPTNPATSPLTHLPLGGVTPTNILIRNQGNPNPDFLSLWLCGLPADGAGADDASDWTNADGTWDYTRKPQVEGNVTWNHEFSISLDGNGNRVITGNNLPDHPTGIFPIQQGTDAWNYDKNPNIISEQVIDYSLPAIPEIATEPN